jgi:hypothetical protein
VIIIFNKNIHGPAIASPRYEKLRQIVEGGRITFLDLSSRSSLSDTIAFEPLWALISEKLQSIHAEDEIVCGRFSAFHLSSVWGASVPANGQLWKASPLDLLAQARIGFPKTEKKDEFLKELLNSAMPSVNHSAVLEGLVEVVASAFLMNAYPPGMHGRADSPQLNTNANDFRIPSLGSLYRPKRGSLYRYLEWLSFWETHRTHSIALC